MSTGHSQMSASRLLAAYVGDMYFEFIKSVRQPAFSVPTLMFPAMFYLLFGVVMGSARGNTQMAQYTLATYGVFGAMAPGLFGFGVALAFEREQGLLTFKQALPMPPAALLLARMVMAMLFVTVISLLLLVLAISAGDVALGVGQAVHLLGVNVLGVLPFCAIGLFVGASVSGQAAPAIINVIYIPMAFLSGLWFPMNFLPDIVQQFAPLWPAYHLAQLALDAIGLPAVGATATHVGALVGFTVVFFCLALRQLGGRGFRLMGSVSSGAGSLWKRAIAVGSFWIAFGLIIAGVVGGNAPRAVAGTAATPTGASEGGSAPPVADPASAAPIGVAAPPGVQIADFEGTTQAAYGIGWTATDDRARGGNSTVAQRLVEGGAGHAGSALEVSGEVGTAIQYPFVGTSFLPNGKPEVSFANQGFMDYSAKETLRFEARGDGGRYMVALMGPVLDAIPAMYSFVAGPEWQEVRVPLRELGGLDRQRVKVISIGTMTPGAFRFQIDGVRIE